MATAEPHYELVLMLDPEAPDERREAITDDARRRIESGGALQSDATWGTRKLAFEIKRRTEADYRFFRFTTGGDLLEELNHNLRIADGVLRYRIFEVDPEAPAGEPPASAAPAGEERREERRERQQAATRAAEAERSGEGPLPEAGEPAAEAPQAEAAPEGEPGAGEGELEAGESEMAAGAEPAAGSEPSPAEGAEPAAEGEPAEEADEPR